jgi:hypothetical protein
MTGDEKPHAVPGQQRVVVEQAHRVGDVLTTRVRVMDGEGDIPRDLDSPASLLGAKVGEWIELHQAERPATDVLVFRTFGETEIPPVGGEFRVQWWWIGGVQQMLIDTPKRRRAIVTSHWFCPLTYENLDDGNEAYTDDQGHWISVRGWEEFVRDDRLRLRTT